MLGGAESDAESNTAILHAWTHNLELPGRYQGFSLIDGRRPDSRMPSAFRAEIHLL